MKEIPLIKNSWQSTKLLCGKCENKPEMSPVVYGVRVFYECKHCHQQVPVNIFEKILDNIAILNEERFLQQELSSLTGEKFTLSKKYKCKIEEESEMFNKWSVSIKS